MTYDTINDARTVAGNAEGTLLANRYRVVRQLGQGGMGSVWLVEDTQLDDKPFAIKMLPSILVSNKRAYRQLKDEALVAMQLVHPNIVQIRAFEENDGNPFLVMDYVDGQTLDDYLAEHAGTTGVSPVEHGSTGTTGVPPVAGCLSEAEVLRILRPIAAALDYAHAKGVVHRDVKPGNVMIAKDGTPYILDFGIAREIQETLTRVTGKLSSGTLLYMSPEQLMGEQPKPAQDVYSFAAMVYECLKGEPPFSHGQIEFQIMNKLPEPLARPTGGTLAASVMAGLAKNQEDRPVTCVAVLRGSGAPAVSGRTVSGNGKSAASPNQQQPGGSRSCATVPPTGGARPYATAAVLSAVALLALGGVIWYRNAQRQELSRRSVLAAQQTAVRRQEEEKSKRAEESARRKADAERRMNEESRAKEEAERRRKAEEERLAAERRAKDLATEKRIEAKVQQGKVARISDGDGFKVRKDSLEDVFVRAEASYDENAKRWAEAEALYKDYIDQSKDVISLDGERQRAVAKRSEVQASFKKAEAAGAKTYARESWNAAVKTWNAAAAEFGSGDFVTATEKFSNALREFEDCAIEARNKKQIAEEKLAEEQRQAEARAAENRRREELERQAEEQRRQEERRKAMQSLPGKWACSTTYTTWWNDSHDAITLKYEIEFMRNGNYVKRQFQDSGLISTTSGTWTQSGNRLTMRPSGSNIQHQGRTYAYDASGEYEYEIRWRADGTFELRCNVDFKRKSARSHLKDYDCFYDEDGTFVSHWTTRQVFTTYKRKDTETAQIFRRVSN